MWKENGAKSNVQIVGKSGTYVECVQYLGRKPTTAIRYGKIGQGKQIDELTFIKMW